MKFKTRLKRLARAQKARASELEAICVRTFESLHVKPKETRHLSKGHGKGSQGDKIARLMRNLTESRSANNSGQKAYYADMRGVRAGDSIQVGSVSVGCIF